MNGEERKLSSAPAGDTRVFAFADKLQHEEILIHTEGLDNSAGSLEIQTITLLIRSIPQLWEWIWHFTDAMQ